MIRHLLETANIVSRNSAKLWFHSSHILIAADAVEEGRTATALKILANPVFQDNRRPLYPIQIHDEYGKSTVEVQACCVAELALLLCQHQRVTPAQLLSPGGLLGAVVQQGQFGIPEKALLGRLAQHQINPLKRDIVDEKMGRVLERRILYWRPAVTHRALYEARNGLNELPVQTGKRECRQDGVHRGRRFHGRNRFIYGMQGDDPPGQAVLQAMIIYPQTVNRTYVEQNSFLAVERERTGLPLQIVNPFDAILPEMTALIDGIRFSFLTFNSEHNRNCSELVLRTGQKSNEEGALVWDLGSYDDGARAFHYHRDDRGCMVIGASVESPNLESWFRNNN